MLLSHNFDIADEVIPPLSREEFAKLFIEGLRESAQCRLVNNPHWIVEVLFDTSKFSPTEMGEKYAQALLNIRRSQIKEGLSLPHILILGGIKTTPAMSSSPDSLQPGEWGVDVVETIDAQRFLEGIGWETAIATKPSESIFKVEVKN
ncbi:MAG: DUF2656 domain-containing protein [Methylacidiphilales bacterium]|nr:DUF2656 domain-containing protein [Candidatus Methylacidiphilales bacterium]NJR17317.1 DUF2656 domain-containing protein [Calothrix sp. CSU_2_0]